MANNNNNKLENLVNSNELTKVEQLNTPIIFKKKSAKPKNNTLNFISNFTGITRHYTPAAQEWVNSIYAYNKNYAKLLPVVDKSILLLLKGYLNLFLTHKVLKTKRRFNRSKRLSAKRVFVGKGDFKHTSDKVIITFYVYDTDNFALRRKTFKLFNLLYLPNKKLVKQAENDINGKKVVAYNRKHSLDEFLNLASHVRWYYSYVNRLVIKLNKYLSIVNNVYGDVTKLVNKNSLSNSERLSIVNSLDLITKDYADLTKLVNKKVLDENQKVNVLKHLAKDNALVGNNKTSLESISISYPSFLDYMRVVKGLYENKWKKSLYLFMLSNAKYEEPFISLIKRLVKNAYNKKVEFNIVNLKKMQLNSDIYTQAVNLKIRKKENNLYKVIRLSFRKAKLPLIHRIDRRHIEPSRQEYIVNSIRNTYVNSMFNNDITNVDSLNNLILNYFPSTENLNEVKPNRFSSTVRKVTLRNFILKNLKHLELSGIRLEARGRLTRRATASRSIFKLKWRGGLKNIDSSFKGLSTIMLRGDFKSNVQYSMLNNKTRNGSFGLKGWVGSK